MHSQCTLEFEYESEEQAIAIAKAVEADNEGFVDMRIEGCKLVSNIEADTIASLLHTIDDFLVCVSTAECVLSNSAKINVS